MPSFLANYTTLTSGDECPANYHLWSGIYTISAALGRRVWINWGRFKIRPILYIVHLGPPGNGKTTAMDIAKNMIRELKIPYSAECQTKESFCKNLADYVETFSVDGKPEIQTQCCILVTELSHFLGPNSGHMIDFLTTIYDRDYYDTKTKNKDDDIILGPAVSLLGCTTPTWVTNYLKSDIISGGFTRRTLFVNEDESPNRIPFPEISTEQVLAGSECIAYARTLKKLAGEYQWDPSAKAFFSNWYRSYKLPTDLAIRWYHKTKHILLLKIAMCIAASHSYELVMRQEWLEMAMEAMDRIEPNLSRVFQGMGRNELHAVSNKLLDILRMAGGKLPEKKLDMVMGREANSREMFEVKEHLIKTDVIERAVEKLPNGVEKVMLKLKGIQ